MVEQLWQCMNLFGHYMREWSRYEFAQFADDDRNIGRASIGPEVLHQGYPSRGISSGCLGAIGVRLTLMPEDCGQASTFPGTAEPIQCLIVEITAEPPLLPRGAAHGGGDQADPGAGAGLHQGPGKIAAETDTEREDAGDRYLVLRLYRPAPRHVRLADQQDQGQISRAEATGARKVHDRARLPSRARTMILTPGILSAFSSAQARETDR